MKTMIPGILIFFSSFTAAADPFGFGPVTAMEGESPSQFGTFHGAEQIFHDNAHKFCNKEGYLVIGPLKSSKLSPVGIKVSGNIRCVGEYVSFRATGASGYFPPWSDGMGAATYATDAQADDFCAELGKAQRVSPYEYNSIHKKGEGFHSFLTRNITSAQYVCKESLPEN